MQTTRWIDAEMSSLDAAISKMESVVIADSDGENTTQYLNWETGRVFEKNQTIDIREKHMEFNCVSFSYDKIIPGEQLVEGIQHKYNGIVIVYSDGAHVNYIIDKFTNSN
jgi:hypothetical protein